MKIIFLTRSPNPSLRYLIPDLNSGHRPRLTHQGGIGSKRVRFGFAIPNRCVISQASDQTSFNPRPTFKTAQFDTPNDHLAINYLRIHGPLFLFCDIRGTIYPKVRPAPHITSPRHAEHLPFSAEVRASAYLCSHPLPPWCCSRYSP